MKKSLLLIFTLLILISCATSKLSTVLSIQEMEVPPGTQKIADNLYIDKAEIRNLDYMEYLHWTGKVFGTNSEEYMRALPDSTVWSSVNIGFVSLDSTYFRRLEYRNLSVLGVSNEQAKLFCKWRSDRVLEFMLIRWKVLKWDPAPTRETAFTIEKYFTGKHLNLQPDKNLLFYPDYRLLDPSENTGTGFKTICRYKKWL